VLIYSGKERQKINSDDRRAAVLPPTILCVNILWKGEAKDKQRRQKGCCSSTYKYGRRGKR
jgi:hypothetical protein